VHRKLSLALGVLLALVSAGCGSSGHLGAKDLSQQLDALQSHAAEGALLAEDAAAGRSTRTFTSEHAIELSRAAAEVEAALRASTTEPALEPTLRRMVVLADRISADLERLATASAEEDATLARQLEASQKLAAGLE
jgi:hypothetical protein